MPNKLPRDFFFGVILFVLVITGGVTLINTIIVGETDNADMAVPGLMDGGGVSVDKFNAVFTNSSIIEKVSEIDEKMQGLQPEEESANIFTLSGAFISTAWASVELVLSSLSIMNETIDGLSSILHIPPWVIIFITTLITAFFIFSILSLIFGKDI